MAPFKSSLARSAEKLFGVFRETDLSLRGATQSSRVPIPPFSAISATGGSTFTPGDGYKYHIYTNAGSNPFNVTDAGTPGAIEYVLIAGGGGGADRGNGAGGGGAGGVFGHGMELPGSAHQAGAVTVTVQNYSLVIGAGGLGSPANSGGEGAGSNGTPSTGFGKTAVGGGGAGSVGGAGAPRDGVSWYTGGGAGGYNASASNGGATLALLDGVYAGGDASGSAPNYGGGGGASNTANGSVGTSTEGGAGGAGTVSLISGASVTYGTGGTGGANGAGASGASNTGIGGSGGTTTNNGGSGVVIIRYAI